MIEQRIHGGDIFRIAAETGLPPEAILDFSANINPRGLPRAAREKLKEFLNQPERLLHYPDWESHLLRSLLAEKQKVPVESIVIGAGAAALLTDTIRALRPSNCIAFIPAFAEYQRVCTAAGCTFTGIPISEINRCPDIVQDQRPDLLILNTPHNPTGALFFPDQLRTVFDEAKKTKTTVLVDEAFIDYVPEAAITAEAAARPNVISIRSLTKFYGCPALRIGYAIVHPSFASVLASQLPAWPVGQVELDTLAAAVSDVEYARATIEQNQHERSRLADCLRTLGFSVCPSHANFILAQLPPNWHSSVWLREHLCQHDGILIRNCDSFDGLEKGRYIRIAVLGPGENDRLIEALTRAQKA